MIGGYRCGVEISAENPETAVQITQDIFKEIESKVASIRVADSASGQYIRGYS